MTLPIGLQNVALKRLNKTWQEQYNDLVKTNEQITNLTKQRREILAKLETLSKTHELFGGKGLKLTPEQKAILKEKPGIGDTIEAMLKERGPMKKSEVRSELEQKGLLTTKNARVILANTLKRDKRKRFRVEDGEVSLRKE